MMAQMNTETRSKSTRNPKLIRSFPSSPELEEFLKRASAACGRSVSFIIREAIEKYVKDNNPAT
jgi:predicted DNA-binding protein